MMRYLPHCLQQHQVEKTASLLAKQYRTFSGLYKDPLESQAQIFQQLVRYRYHRDKNTVKADPLLARCETLLDLRELIIEILDREQGFNRLELKQQIEFENRIFEILRAKGIDC